MPFKLSRNKFFGIKNEVAQNTNIAVTNADYITIQDATFKIGKNLVDRDYKRGALDSLSSVVAERWAEIEVTTELRNSSSFGFPELESLFTACGTATSMSNSTQSLNPISVAQTGFFSPATSSTINFYEDGLKYVANGVIGNCKGTLEAGKVAMVTFSLKGLLSGSVEDASNPVPTGTLTSAPPIVQSVSLHVGSYAPIAVNKLDFDFGVETAMLSDVSSVNAVYGFLATGRAPTVTLNPVVDTVANHPAISAMIAGTEYSIGATIGTAAGNIVELSFPTVQYTEVATEDRSGVLAYTITGKANGTGNDSFRINLR